MNAGSFYCVSGSLAAYDQLSGHASSPTWILIRPSVMPCAEQRSEKLVRTND